MALPEPPTAIMTSTDSLAFGVLHAAHDLGMSVPRELSVVGFDDILLASHTVPALDDAPDADGGDHRRGAAARDRPGARHGPLAWPERQGDRADPDRPPVDGPAARLTRL